MITSDGHTIGSLVLGIYNEGRSQISHGGNRFGLLNDLPVDLDLADSFCETSIAMYLMRLSIYNGKDEYTAFLEALPSLFRQIENGLKQTP